MLKFSMNNKNYELVATAQDQSIESQGKMAVYRIVGTSEYFVCPMADLLPFLPLDKKREAQLDQRLQIYKELFVGRKDVYAHRYYNKKVQKEVYAPATHFKNGRPVKGAEGWIPLTDEKIKEHLNNQSDEFLGFYPMYADNTCKFVVIDIDKQNWHQICTVIRSVCSRYKVPLLVEVSQSGNGCHIWIFFKVRIKAAKARKLADQILQATLEVYPSLPFSAFDRFFPSQDFIEPGKTGNLIAAPLQGQRRKKGKTVFVGENFAPFSNQWQVLQEAKRLDEDSVDQIIQKITDQNQVEIFSEYQVSPQEESLDKLVYFDELHVIKSNMLYISKDGLSKKQIGYLKTLGAYWNPQFFERQRQRLSTYRTPRIINLTIDLPDFLALPRGVEDHLKEIVPHIDWQIQTVSGKTIAVTFNGKLRREQADAEKKMLENATGVLAARTGFGKTVIAASMIARRKVSTLILVNIRDLAQQWCQRLKSFLEVTSTPLIEEYTPTGRKRKKDVIGRYYGSIHNRSGVIDVATIQSFKEIKKSQAILDDYGMVIFDEVHHLPAFSFDAVFKNIRARYIYGLSATPYRQDGLSKIITLRMGDVRYQTDLVDSQYALKVKRLVIPRFTDAGMSLPELQTNTINENYEFLAGNTKRNQEVVTDIQNNVQEGRHLLVLTHRLDHLQEIARLLETIVKCPVFKLFGAQGSKQNKEVIEKLNVEKGPFVILATAKYAGEGMDIPALDTIVLSMPSSWKGTIFQYLGRLQRNLANKDELRVYDYVDMLIPAFAKMYQKRKNAYKELAYMIQEDESSRRSNVEVYEGDYHLALQKKLKTAAKVVLAAKSMTPFIFWGVVHNMKNQCTILLNKVSASYGKRLQDESISYTLTENSVPECILIDDTELWLSSDKGFNSNRGIAICITSADTVNGFKKIIKNEL